ncbi:hypothetical protein KZZ52_16475 [Dactylosporangium sp. AC04546]|uniref:hypothetical protein n=1 Tax=Dactylosporangium sp. AC04546 TaxID=2862460 RepID=UPI002E7C4142|nr:hypothetical protein [Dactylosporangium sp. AC04546]WVK86897.1 hypothetical protein KZZ52_16475 [Dactylosporangium sp. AC04546]
MHRDNGMPSQRAVAAALQLRQPSRVGAMLRGEALPADEPQARRLLEALGAVGAEVERGVRLYHQARAEERPAPEWWWRSGYLEQVGDIAPARLVDRRAELDELAAWCSGGNEPYVWWQAGPRAGKSALMAWFVRHPPPRVWVVSFFVTARYAGQADSAAFTDGLLEQLAAITGEQVPPVTSAVARDGLRRQLLAEAAARAANTGHRLVLLVDGLDEDCGSLPGSGLPSIAACLPKRPPDGLRIIVAGRPDPPIPADVDLDHPLRTCPVRPLAPSPHAEQTTELAQRELDEVLATDPDRHRGLGFEVLGLVTACGGGLQHRDLQQLTGRPAFEIDRLLRGLFGRTVAGRADPHTAARVFLFTHETLRVQAIDRLGRDTLTVFLDRIHAWAAGYQRGGWPADTPAYLLRAYGRLLADHHDAPRLAALATDAARHDRMLHITGGDAAALADIAATFTLITAQAQPELLTALRLAWHRDRLTDRNTNIPTGLPAAWAALGQPVRAEALVRSIPDPYRRARAWAALIAATAVTGDQPRIETLTGPAEATALTITDAVARSEALAALATAFAEAGDVDRAETIARSITDPAIQARTLTILLDAVAGTGDRGRLTSLADQAATSARSITNPYPQAQLLTELVRLVARTGDVDQAETIARSVSNHFWRAQVSLALVATVAEGGDLERAEAIARSITNSASEAQVLAALVATAARAGDLERAEAVARSVANPYSQVPALTALVRAFTATGDRDRAVAVAKQAEVIAGSITDPYSTAQVLTDLATAVAGAGDRGLVEALAGKALRTAHTIANQDSRAQALTALVTAVVDIGDHPWAEAIARTITDADRQAEAYTVLLSAFARTGDYDRAETIARSVTEAHRQMQLLAVLARMAAQAGDHAEAEAASRTITDPDRLAQLLTELATTVAAAGDRDRAAALAEEAEATARTITNRAAQDDVLAALATAVAEAGDHDQATAIARTITTPDRRTRALADLVPENADGRVEAIADPGRRARQLVDLVREVADHLNLDQASTVAELARKVVVTGDRASVAALAEQVTAFSRSISDRRRAAPVLCALVAVVAEAGDHDRAEGLVWSISSPYWRATAIARLVHTVAETDRTVALTNQATSTAESITDPHARMRVLITLVRAVAETGNRGLVATLARRAVTTGGQVEPGSKVADELAALVHTVAETGDHDLATQLARRVATIAESLTDPARRAKALTALAQTVADAGDHDLVLALTAQAEAAAESIEFSSSRALALTRLAEFLGPERRRSVIARALAVGPWTIALDAVARADPEALRAFADKWSR